MQTLAQRSSSRVCPGRHMAIDTLWIVIASVLAALEISKSDEDAEIPPEHFTSGFVW
jgi:hypothetical protein